MHTASGRVAGHAHAGVALSILTPDPMRTILPPPFFHERPRVSQAQRTRLRPESRLTRAGETGMGGERLTSLRHLPPLIGERFCDLREGAAALLPPIGTWTGVMDLVA